MVPSLYQLPRAAGVQFSHVAYCWRAMEYISIVRSKSIARRPYTGSEAFTQVAFGVSVSMPLLLVRIARRRVTCFRVQVALGVFA